jgi:hypothetical protein
MFKRKQYKMSITFPLILTFSPWEKEQQLDTCSFPKTVRAAVCLQFTRTLEAFPPLPPSKY